MLEFKETLNIVIIYSKDMINKHTMPNFQFKNHCIMWPPLCRLSLELSALSKEFLWCHLNNRPRRYRTLIIIKPKDYKNILFHAFLFIFYSQMPLPVSTIWMISQMHLRQSEAAPKASSTHCKTGVPSAWKAKKI